MSYKIALTSSNGLDIDLHFGHTRLFTILQVEEDSGAWEFLEQRILRSEVSQARPDAAPSCGGCGSGQGHQDGHIQSVIKILAGCTYMLTVKIGPRPQAVLKQAGITALESPQDISRAVQQLNVYHQRVSRKERLYAAAVPAR
jgi:predicted Fe-Mo cluster-binding NifX family protein